MDTPKQEICSIRIVFPTKSDDEAIGFKKKIAALLSEMPDAIIQFSLNSAPADRPMKG